MSFACALFLYFCMTCDTIFDCKIYQCIGNDCILILVWTPVTVQNRGITKLKCQIICHEHCYHYCKHTYTEVGFHFIPYVTKPIFSLYVIETENEIVNLKVTCWSPHSGHKSNLFSGFARSAAISAQASSFFCLCSWSISSVISRFLFWCPRHASHRSFCGKRSQIPHSFNMSVNTVESTCFLFLTLVYFNTLERHGSYCPIWAPSTGFLYLLGSSATPFLLTHQRIFLPHSLCAHYFSSILCWTSLGIKISLYITGFPKRKITKPLVDRILASSVL